MLKSDDDGKYPVSTHSRPKAAGLTATLFVPTLAEFQLTAARRRLGLFPQGYMTLLLFQLTAARRRLGYS